VECTSKCVTVSLILFRPSYHVYESRKVLDNRQIFCLGFLFRVFAFHPCSSGFLYFKQLIQIDLCFCHSKSFSNVILYKNQTIGNFKKIERKENFGASSTASI
jgi:hypothetical protein